MKTLIKSFSLAALAIISGAGILKAQQNKTISTTELLGQRRVITTAVPFLIITPDTRAGGMGDAGVAVSPDANTIHWNPAKLAFMPYSGGLSVSYTPWLRTLVPDIDSLSYLSGYKKIDKFSGIGGSLRYFSLGDIQFTDYQGNNLQNYRPYEMAVDLAYARKLSDHFSMALAGRFIYSDLSGKTPVGNGSTTSAGVSFGADVGGFYTTEIKVAGNKTDFNLGFNISNMGPKISYTSNQDKDFIPTNLRLGSYMNMHIDEFNEIAVALDFNKLLVPTNPVYKLDSTNQVEIDPVTKKPVILNGRDPNQPVIAGMFSSFSDAPGGFREELREINPSIGVEYWYDKQFAGRVGYFYEHPTKGNRQFFTVGAGIRYNVFAFDFAYLIPARSQKSVGRSPLDNTLRFTLQFNFEGKKKSSGNGKSK